MLSVSEFRNPNLNLTLRVFKTPDESIYFPAVDFATKLGYENPRWAVITHVSDEYKIRFEDLTRGSRFATPFRIQPHTQFLSEEGGYQMVLRSNLPLAVDFQKWVFEILKSIRRTGGYHLPGALPKFRAITDADFETTSLSDDETKELRRGMDRRRDQIKDKKMSEKGRVGGSVAQQRRRDMIQKIKRLVESESEYCDKIWELEEENAELRKTIEALTEYDSEGFEVGDDP